MLNQLLFERIEVFFDPQEFVSSVEARFTESFAFLGDNAIRLSATEFNLQSKEPVDSDRLSHDSLQSDALSPTHGLCKSILVRLSSCNTEKLEAPWVLFQLLYGAQEGNKHPGREAAKYRTQLREVEGERDGLQTKVAALQNSAALSIASRRLHVADDLFNVGGIDVEQLANDDGNQRRQG